MLERRHCWLHDWLLAALPLFAACQLLSRACTLAHPLRCWSVLCLVGVCSNGTAVQ
jgi:hypothetical protein